MAGLEGAEAVEDERLAGGGAGAEPLVEQQAVAPEALDLALDGGVGEAELAGDLAVGGAGEGAEEQGPEQLRALEPVAGGEGL